MSSEPPTLSEIIRLFYFKKGLKRIVGIGLTGNKGISIAIRNDKERQGTIRNDKHRDKER